jgi:inorganic pyrophosphatase
MLDGDEVDDKIIAVLKDDTTYGSATDISEISYPTLDRLHHYFVTYKQAPGSDSQSCRITHMYGASEAREIIARSLADYKHRFGDLESILNGALGLTQSNR